ncbi:MAG: F0F1 ATP synthase subunit gamma [Acidimicrobiales bacterium]
MASGQERVLRRRIRSVASTRKITRAMELIAASRIVKAQGRVAAARPYAEQITVVIANLASGGAGSDHPLLVQRPQVACVGVVVLSADRGLAGAYNSSVIRAGERVVQAAQAAGQGYALVLAGRKAEGYFRYRGYQVAEAFSGFSEKPTYEDARRVAAAAMGRYERGEIDQVDLVYTQFFSMGVQKVVTTRLLPLERNIVAAGAGSPGPAGGAGHAAESEGPKADYEFEPAPGEILARLLPRYVEARVFAALLDASASEQAARQRAMKAATDNAEELIKNLSVVANKVRQAGITTEIMEIVGGSEALRQAESGSTDLLIDTAHRIDLFAERVG